MKKLQGAHLRKPVTPDLLMTPSDQGDVDLDVDFAADRGNWTGKLDFLLSCIGYCVGLGNVWRFPYRAYTNGGGAFLVPYFLMLAICGIPLFFLELSLGQFSSLGPLAVWKISPLFKGAGAAMLLIVGLVAIYYNMIIAYVLFYLFASLTSDLPWEHCGNWWNTDLCREHRGPKDHNGTPALNLSGTVSPSEEYWRWCTSRPRSPTSSCSCCWSEGSHSRVLGRASSSISPPSSITCCLLRCGSRPPCRSSTPWVWASGGFSPLPPTTPSTKTSIGTPSSSPWAMPSPASWPASPSSPCWATCRRNWMSLWTRSPKQAMTMLPLAPFWSFLFFFMLLTLGLDSQFAFLETIVTSVTDEFPYYLRPKKAVFSGLICVAMYLMGLVLTTDGGMYWLVLLDDYSASFGLMVVVITTCLAVTRVYGIQRFCRDIHMMLGFKPGIYFRACWLFLSPATLLALLVYSIVKYQPSEYGSYRFPAWAELLGILMGLLSCLMIPAGMLVAVLREEGSLWERLQQASRPTMDWGPSLEENRTGMYVATLAGSQSPKPLMVHMRKYGGITSFENTAIEVDREMAEEEESMM
ncbi:sodium-dependent proline transporter isoform X3 [Erinaceus europaeus]|uniref:Transporter n=1 Tax=Erinaceus europaeus TaxID=9365 RepID=A0ABM3WKH1_ERIEU|nr:sodium-dependent proline transporter isoform X3 [Erinaceus europaeus]